MSRKIWLIMLVVVGLMSTGFERSDENTDLSIEFNEIKSPVLSSDEGTIFVVGPAEDYCCDIAIYCTDGNKVLIETHGSEIKVTGASEEGARMFFEVMLQDCIDQYIESELERLCGEQK